MSIQPKSFLPQIIEVDEPPVRQSNFPVAFFSPITNIVRALNNSTLSSDDSPKSQQKRHGKSAEKLKGEFLHIWKKNSFIILIY